MLCNLLAKKFLAECGHKTYKKDKIFAFGEECVLEIPVEKGKMSHCHRCLEKMTIRCAWCGKVIFIEDPITLYSPAKEDFEIPKHAVIYNEELLQLVGCLRWDCAETDADRMGFWLPPGKVERVLSPIEQCMQTGNIVVVDDFSKM